ETVVRIADDLPPIHADARQIQQLLLNLSLNAIDAMPRGGGTLTIAAARDSGAVVITVRDTGIGIEPEMVRKIFQPFVTANKRRGLGLGLPICDRIAQTHRGTIAVESQPGAGTTFTVRLPAAEGVSSDNQTATVNNNHSPK